MIYRYSTNLLFHICPLVGATGQYIQYKQHEILEHFISTAHHFD